MRYIISIITLLILFIFIKYSSNEEIEYYTVNYKIHHENCDVIDYSYTGTSNNFKIKRYDKYNRLICNGDVITTTSGDIIIINIKKKY